MQSCGAGTQAASGGAALPGPTHLPHCCERLLLRDVVGPLAQAKPLAAHAHGAGGHHDDVESSNAEVTHHLEGMG